MSVSGYMKIAMRALDSAGIPSRRGFPTAKLQMPANPVAVIGVEKADLQETVFAVHIYSPAPLGGTVCEDAAQTAAAALRAKRAFCLVEACQFDGRNNLFSVKILATWKESIVNRVVKDQDYLAYVTSFSAVQTRQVQQVTDAETGKTSVVNEEVVWTIAVQEQLPFDQVLEVESKEAFTLKVTHENYVETFPECYWLSITLEENGGGLLRKRIARSWTERIVEWDDPQA